MLCVVVWLWVCKLFVFIVCLSVERCRRCSLVVGTGGARMLTQQDLGLMFPQKENEEGRKDGRKEGKKNQPS